MNKKLRKPLFGLVLTLIIIFAFGVSYAKHPGGDMPPPPFTKLLMFSVSGMGADRQNLYVMAGGTIMQYGLTDMKLLKTVDLPELPPPPVGKDGFPCPPFPPPGSAPPHGIYAGEGFLYVLLGPRVYRYSTPELILKDTVEIPRPEVPKPGK